VRKRISLKTRRPDLSRTAFRDYYENRHVPLGLSFIGHFGWLRYVRNHIVSSEGALVSFDCFTEFWVDDDSDDDALYRFLRSPDFRRLDEDDRQFLDISRRMSFEVRETVLRHATPVPATLWKKVLIWKQVTNPREAAETLANRILQRFQSQVVSATLDSVVAPVPAETPFDNMLSLTLREDVGMPLEPTLLPESRWAWLAVDPVETPPEQLAESRGSRVSVSE